MFIEPLALQLLAYLLLLRIEIIQFSHDLLLLLLFLVIAAVAVAIERLIRKRIGLP